MRSASTTKPVIPNERSNPNNHQSLRLWPRLGFRWRARRYIARRQPTINATPKTSIARCCRTLREWRYSYRSSHSDLGSANRCDEFWDDLMQIAHQAISRNLEDRRVGVFVDRDDNPGILYARQMLDRAGDAKRDVQLGRDDLAGLSDLIIVGGHACVDCRAGGTDCAAQRVR